MIFQNEGYLNNSIRYVLSVKILVFQAFDHIRQHIAHCGSDDVGGLIFRPTGPRTVMSAKSALWQRKAIEAGW